MNRIKQTMLELGDNDGFYNPSKLLPYFDDDMVFFIVGERRIGKTDYFLHLACKLYLDHQMQTMWIRNKLVELQDPTFASAFLNDAKLHGWCPEEWIVRKDGVYTSDDKDADQVILFQSISTFSNRRGGANPRVLMMVFDEFQPEDRKYPAQCSKGLLSLTKTVFSGNTECRVFCLSNIVSAVNPYFARLRIYPRDIITNYPDKRMLIEKCRGYRKAIMENNPWNSVYRAGSYGDYADESEDKILSLVINHLPKGCKPYPYFIVASSGVVYRMWNDEKRIYFAPYGGKIPSNAYLYTDDREQVSSTVLLIPDVLRRTLTDVITNGSARYVGANCMFDIMSILFPDM